MAPNPIAIPRRSVHQSSMLNNRVERRPQTGSGISVLSTSIIVLLVATTAWARKWFFSGAAIETLLITYGDGNDYRILQDVPLWTLLASYNLLYAICSTSWLLHAAFASASYPFILLTCLNQFPRAANLARRGLRQLLGEKPHFIRDKLALFNLPALEIDTDVDGLLVIRGVTMSFSTLTVVAHGIELGLKLAEDIELAIHCEEVTVRFFRRIEIGDCYANVKGGKFEMTFGEVNDGDATNSEFSVLLDDTPLLRAAAVGSKGYESLPKLTETLSGASHVTDSSARAVLDQVTAVDPDDEKADRYYDEKLTEIRTSSAVYQSRQQVRLRAKNEGQAQLDDGNDMRAATCAELQNSPSVPHPPERSVRVTTLQNLSPPDRRRFMHRVPFLLRLLLAPLSYFHPISISSITAAGSGKRVSTLLQDKVFKHYLEHSAELRRLHRKISTWLADANFCVELTDIEGLGQVPLTTNFDIVTYLKFGDFMAYRTIAEGAKISQVLRLGGADATFVIPSYLLPHHEHIIPPKVAPQDQEDIKVEIDQADAAPQTVQAEHKLEQAQKDEASITMSVHGSLPVSCDQSLLNFIAALLKATKIVDMEKEVMEVMPGRVDTPLSPTLSDDDASETLSLSPEDDSISEKLSMKDVAGFKLLAKSLKQNIRDGTIKGQIKDFTKDLHQNSKDGMKKAAVGGLVNDRWIARMVGKIAAKLQKAQGDVGYSGAIPIPLEPYRKLWEDEGRLLKILP